MAPLTLCVASFAMFISCKSNKNTTSTAAQVKTTEGLSPAAKALTESALLESEVELLRLGSVWLDKPNDTFLNSGAIASLKNELLKAAIQNSNAWRFEKCAAVFTLPDSQDPKDCAYLLEKSSAVAFEFFLIPAENGKPCTSLSERCSVHQAIRVKAWNNGVQRPALFVTKTPIKSPLTVVLATPPNGDDGDTRIALASTTPFPTELANRLSQNLGLKNVRVENLIHLSNIWMEKNRQEDLKQARWQAFHIVSLSMGLSGTVSAVSSLGTMSNLTNFGKMLLGLNLIASPAGVVSETVALFDLKKLEPQMPQGPARTTLQIAIMIANAAPWLGATNFGANLVELSSKTILRAHVLQAFAKSNRKLLADLTIDAVNSAADAANARTQQLAESLRTGDLNAAANEINAAVSLSGAAIVPNTDANFSQVLSTWRDAKNAAEAKNAIRDLAKNANQIFDLDALRVGSGNCMNASYALVQRMRGNNVSAVPYALPADGITKKMLLDVTKYMGETIVNQTPDVETTIEGFDAWLKANLHEGEAALVQSWARNGQTPIGHTTLAVKRFGEVIHINNQYSRDIISTVPMWDTIWKGYFGNAIGYSAFVLGQKVLP
jgi:hypothetical protein